MTYSLHPGLHLATLNDLVALAQADPLDDTAAMDEIVRRFEPLARRIARSFPSADADLRDDLVNAARAGLVRAVRRHNGALSFPAFARIHMRGAAMRELGRWIVPETPATDAVDRLLAQQPAPDDLDAVLDRISPWGGGDVASVVAALPPLQRVLVELRYLDDAPISAIAEITGTSGPAVSQRLATVHRAVARAQGV